MRPPQLPPAPNGEPQQSLQPGAPLAADWWQLFRHPGLDALVREALASNLSIDVARANLSQAENLLKAQRGTRLPQLDLLAGHTRSATRQSATGNVDERSSSVGLGATFDIDLFGGGRRSVEKSLAWRDYQAAQLAQAQLLLTRQLVMQVLNAAILRERLQAIKRVIGLAQQHRGVTASLFEAGKGTQLDVLTADQALAQARTQVPALQLELDLCEHAVALLLGRAPGTWSLPALSLKELRLPESLPLVLPSQLLQRRPDIAASEALLRGHNAEVGVATAALYPRVSLSAGWSRQSGETETALGVFDGRAQLRNLAFNLLVPVFRGGTLKSQRDAAVDAYAAQLAQYRQLSLEAFGQVADVLSALEQGTLLLVEQEASLQNALQMLMMSRESYAAGQSSMLQVLEAQRVHQIALIGAIMARGQRHLDTVRLFAAMGGGWERLPPTDGHGAAGIAPAAGAMRRLP